MGKGSLFWWKKNPQGEDLGRGDINPPLKLKDLSEGKKRGTKRCQKGSVREDFNETGEGRGKKTTGNQICFFSLPMGGGRGKND